MNSGGKILFYRVDPNYIPIFKKTFTDSHIEILESNDLSSAEQTIRNENPDIVLADFESGNEDVVRLLKFVKDQFPSICRMVILKTEEQKKAIFLFFCFKRDCQQLL